MTYDPNLTQKLNFSKSTENESGGGSVLLWYPPQRIRNHKHAAREDHQREGQRREEKLEISNSIL